MLCRPPPHCTSWLTGAVALATLVGAAPVLGAPVEVIGGTLPSLAVSDDGQTALVTFTPQLQSLADGTEAPTVARSDDGGVTWAPVPFPLGTPDYPVVLGGARLAAGNDPGSFFLSALRRRPDDMLRRLIVTPFAAGRPIVGTPTFALADPLVVLADLNLAVDRTTARGGGPGAAQDGTVYLVYDTYNVSQETYLASYLQPLPANGPVPARRQLSPDLEAGRFRGSDIQPVAGSRDGEAWLVGLGVGVTDQTRNTASAHLHQISGGGAAVTRTADLEFFKVGQAMVAGDPGSHGLNGHYLRSLAVLGLARTDGRLYLAWGANPNPGQPNSGDPLRDQGDVRMASSSDGHTWVPVPPPTGGEAKTQFLPALDVDDRGWVHLATSRTRPAPRTRASCTPPVHTSTTPCRRTAGRTGFHRSC